MPEENEEVVQGPILDAIKAKIAKIIEDPTDFIAFVKLLIALVPKSDAGVFSSSSEQTADVVELIEMCQSAQG